LAGFRGWLYRVLRDRQGHPHDFGELRMPTSQTIPRLLRAANWSFAGVAAILAATLAGSAFTERRHPQTLAQPLASIPDTLAGFSVQQDAPLPSSQLKRLVVSDYISRLYARNGHPLSLLITYYAEQRAGESMHSPKQCLPGSGWEIWNYDSTTLPLRDGRVTVNKYFIRKGNERQVVLYWYESSSRIIASEYLGKFLLMRDAALNGRTDGAMVRIIVPDQPEAVKQGVEFASQLIPYMERCFGMRIALADKT
jgi:EpsI family protein